MPGLSLREWVQEGSSDTTSLCYNAKPIPTHYTLKVADAEVRAMLLNQKRPFKAVLPLPLLGKIWGSWLLMVVFALVVVTVSVLALFVREKVWFQATVTGLIVLVGGCELSRADKGMVRLLAFQFQTWFIIVNSLLFATMHAVCRAAKEQEVNKQGSGSSSFSAYASALGYFLALLGMTFIDAFLDAGKRSFTKRVYLAAGILYLAYLEGGEVAGYTNRYKSVEWELGGFTANSQTLAYNGLNNVLIFLSGNFAMSWIRPREVVSIKLCAELVTHLGDKDAEASGETESPAPAFELSGNSGSPGSPSESNRNRHHSLENWIEIVKAVDRPLDGVHV